MNEKSTIACMVWDFVEKEHILLSEYLRREELRKIESEMWEHYCDVEHSMMGMEKGMPCNWCDKSEEDFEDVRLERL